MIALMTMATNLSTKVKEIVIKLNDKKNDHKLIDELISSFDSYHYREDLAAIPFDFTTFTEFAKLSDTNTYANFIIGYATSLGIGIDKNLSHSEEIMKKCISDGNLLAQYQMAEEYFIGDRFTKNHKEALRLVKLCMEQGFHHSFNLMGRMFEAGSSDDSFPQSRDDAIKMYKLAIEKGNKRAYYNIGRLYDIKDDHTYGNDHLDFKEALKWYKLGSEANDSASQCHYGNLYLHGFGVDVDYKEALRWIKLSYDQKNYSLSSDYLKMAFHTMMTNDEGLAEIQKRFFEYDKLKKDNDECKCKTSTNNDTDDTDDTDDKDSHKYSITI